MVRLLALALMLSVWPAEARDPNARAAFKRAHPCPATGKPRGACPGWVIDHVRPLCAGGADRPSNMQWQTRAEAKVKDGEERKMCAGAARRH